MTASFSATPSSAHAQETANFAETVQAIFFVTADADPSMAPRLIEPFAKLGLVPWRVHISSEDGAGEVINADLRVRGVPGKTAHVIGKALRRIVGVRQVIALVE